MKIISRAARPLYHETDIKGISPYRSVSSCFRKGHVPIPESWAKHIQACLLELSKRPRKPTPGNVGILRESDEKSSFAAISEVLRAVGLECAVQPRYVYQTMMCLGASYHDDLHGWADQLFLNWYLTGPPRDFVLKGVGRVTLRPGDVIVFDPSRTHGLLHVKARKFVEADWVLADCEYSIFLSGEIALTPELDSLFGISRGTPSRFAEQGYRNLADFVVNDRTGSLRLPRDTDEPWQKR